jgi:hypothetical protein
VVKIVLHNSRRTPYTAVFRGTDAELVSAYSFTDPSALYCKLEAVNVTRKLDITLRLVPPPGYKTPDDIPLPLACADFSGEARMLVFPGEAAVERGGSLQCWAAVTGKAGAENGDIIWSVEGAQGGTAIGEKTGFLQVAVDETAETLTVVARYARNAALSGTVRIVVGDTRATFNHAAAYPLDGGKFNVILSLNRDIPGLTEENIFLKLEEGETPLSQLLGEGDWAALIRMNGTYTFEAPRPPDGSWTMDITIRKDGWVVTPAARTAAWVKIASSETSNLKEKFSVTTTEKNGVRDTFKVLHAFIQRGGLSEDVIHVGDYIDLEGGLTVENYNGLGGFMTGNKDIKPVSVPFSGYEGKLLRLLVVGINSFQTQEGYAPPAGSDHDATPHVVFQFQNIPVERRLSEEEDVGGYIESEMRGYLTPVAGDSQSGKFLAGLLAAGVPEDVLWSPVRNIIVLDIPNLIPSVSVFGTITDTLWLPSLGELGIANMSTNQAQFDYYQNNERRMKYVSGDNPASTLYWTTDIMVRKKTFPAAISASGILGNGEVDSAKAGVAPAFCVK